LRAKEAATKTEELIRQSVKEAGEGEVTAKQVAGKLGEIASGVSKVSDIVAEIASGAQAQSSGIEQVTRAISEMDKVTQQNAASAEESSSAASELSGQAEELASMIAAFQLESQARTQAAVAPRRALSLPAASSGSGGWSPRTSAAPGRIGAAAAPPAPARDRAPAPVRLHDPFPMDDANSMKEF
jgi:methyl-accepting chemotaxis protein